MSAAAPIARNRSPLSVGECRRLLGPAGETMPDVEVERVREVLYELAAVVVEGFESEVSTVRLLTGKSLDSPS